MLSRLIQKELLHQLLDFRFITVFALCALLSGLSVYVGGKNYARQLQEYHTVSESNRKSFQENTLDKGRLHDLNMFGHKWNLAPQVLSPLVYGLSGALGREARIRYQTPPVFEASTFETDPIHLLFEILDLAFVVKIVLSLSVLLFTYDAICGEKESGTLRLFASFPVAKSTLALAKLIGSILAVLIPFSFAFLLAATVMALSPDVGLHAMDWSRMAALMGVFALYLAVFAAFGLFVSSLTHRRMTAFLALLALWAVWIFVVPNLALDIANRLAPVESRFEFAKQLNQLRWTTRAEARKQMNEYNDRTRVQDWDALTEAQQAKIRRASIDTRNRIDTKLDAQYMAGLRDRQSRRRNQIRIQSRLTTLLSSASPLGAVTFPTMDLARTGVAEQEAIETDLSAHLIVLGEYVRKKWLQDFDDWSELDLSDYPWFSYRNRESIGECLLRNVFHILNLVGLGVLGFVGAYVAILRYDVR